MKLVKTNVSYLHSSKTCKARRSESRKIRGGADAISTNRHRYLGFNFLTSFPSLLTSVSVANTRREKPPTSVLHLNCEFSIKFQFIIKQKFYCRSQQKAKISCRMSFKSMLLHVRFQQFTSTFSTQNIHAEPKTLVGDVNTRRINSDYNSFTSTLLYRRNRSLVKSTSGSARSHSRFASDHGSRIFSYCQRKSEVLYAMVHLNF